MHRASTDVEAAFLRDCQSFTQFCLRVLRKTHKVFIGRGNPTDGPSLRPYAIFGIRQPNNLSPIVLHRALPARSWRNGMITLLPDYEQTGLRLDDACARRRPPG